MTFLRRFFNMAFVWCLLGKIYFPRHDKGRKELQPRHVNAAPIFSNPLQPTSWTPASDGWQRFSARSSDSKVNKSISELRSGHNASCLVNSRLLNHQNGNSNGERKGACRRSGKEGGVFIYIYEKKRLLYERTELKEREAAAAPTAAA